MNLILTIVFLGFMLFSYLNIGEYVLEISNYNKITAPKSIVLGFFLFFCIGFFIGVPCQFLHTSWFVFFYFSLVVYFVFLGFVFYKKRNHIKNLIKHFKSNWKNIIIENIKNHWVLYLMIIILTLFSMSNQMPYYQTNYDDHYYIGKVVQQIEIPQLLSEDFYSGTLIDISSNGFERYFNTYEIMYSFLSSLFHIDVPFFCRVTMVIHNYTLIMLVYYSFAIEYFERKYAQYTILIFCLFFISFGYYNFQKHWIRMYDGWQFQSAIFYGSSVVRVMAIPSLLLYGKDLIEKFDIRKFIVLILLYCSCLSFSTIFLQIAILLTYLFIFVKVINLLIESHYNIKYGILLFLLIGILYGTTKLGWLSCFPLDRYSMFIDNYTPFYTHYVSSNIFFKYAFIILALNFFIIKNRTYFLMNIMLLFMYLMYRNNLFSVLNSISSFFTFFVPLRTIASIEHMLLFILAMEIVFIFKTLRANRLICNIGAITVFACSLGLFYILYDQIIEIDLLGSGVSKDGYSVKRIIENDYMTPELFVKVGEYFNQLEYGNYRLLANDNYEYDDSYINSASLVFASNRIETCIRGGCQMSDDEYSYSIKYFNNTINYQEFESILKEKQIDYVLVNDINKKNELSSHGFSTELIYVNRNQENTFYLMKCPF